MKSVIDKAELKAFIKEQLDLRGVVGIFLSGNVKERLGYPDVLFSAGGCGYAIWLSGDEGIEMRGKMGKQWGCYVCESKGDILDVMNGVHMV